MERIVFQEKIVQNSDSLKVISLVSGLETIRMAEYVGKHLCKKILENINELFSIKDSVKLAFQSLDTEILKQFESYRYADELFNEGCGVLTVVQSNESIKVFSLGDSTSFLAKDLGGEIYRVNPEVNFCQEDLAIIKEKGGSIDTLEMNINLGYEIPFAPLIYKMVMPGKCHLTRGLGFPLTKLTHLGGIEGLMSITPQENSFKITDDIDFLVLCSKKTLFKITKKAICFTIYDFALTSIANKESFSDFCDQIVGKLFEEIIVKDNILNLNLGILFFRSFEEKYKSDNLQYMMKKVKEAQSKFVDNSETLYKQEDSQLLLERKLQGRKKKGCWEKFMSCFYSA